MYRCQKCNKNSKPGRELHKIVIETRPKEYKNIIKIKSRKRAKFSTGYEIVKEMGVCKRCRTKINMESQK